MLNDVATSSAHTEQVQGGRGASAPAVCVSGDVMGSKCAHGRWPHHPFICVEVSDLQHTGVVIRKCFEYARGEPVCGSKHCMREFPGLLVVQPEKAVDTWCARVETQVTKSMSTKGGRCKKSDVLL